MANKFLAEVKKDFTVFEITNSNKESKNYGRKIYVASSYMKEHDILSRIRSIQDSKTGKGGTNDWAKDLRGAGKAYHEDCKVKTIKSGLSKETAEEIKARQIDKATKVYNQSMEVV